MNRLSWLARWVIGLTLALTAQAALAGPSFPELTGRVVDQANVLSPETEATLSKDLEGLEGRSGHQFVVVTVASLQGLEIEDYGILLGRKWGIGRKNANDGVLLIVAPKQRKLRIEVGYGLESVLTNDDAGAIIAQDIVPKFKAGDIEGGVTAGTEAVIKKIDAPPPPPPGSTKSTPLSSAGSSPAPGAGGVSMGTAILIAVVVGLLFKLLGGGKKTEIIYAGNPGGPVAQGGGALPPPVDANGLPLAGGAMDPSMVGMANPATGGGGVLPGLIMGAGAGAGGMLLANRIRTGKWMGGGGGRGGGLFSGPGASGRGSSGGGLFSGGGGGGGGGYHGGGGSFGGGGASGSW